MKYTKILVMAIMALVGVFTVSAYYGQGYGMMQEDRLGYENNTFHEYMEEIVEEGTYADLVAYRAENSGFGGPRWVTDEESFDEWKEMHEYMESRLDMGYERGFLTGTQGGRGTGGAGRCPMWD